MVKKALLGVLMLALAAHVARAAVEIKDVDPNSWSYGVIQKLIDKGYLTLYDDKTFRPDQPVTRVVLAAALGRLLDQLESGAIKMSAGDVKEVKKLIDSLKGDMADLEAQYKALEKRVADIESGKVVIQQDISKAAYELKSQNDKLKQDVGILNTQVETLTVKLDKSEKARKQTQTMMLIGLLVAIAVGASN